MHIRRSPIRFRATRSRCLDGIDAIAWTDIVATLPHNDPGREVYAEAITYGFREGLVVPVRTGDGSLGLVSAGGDRDKLAPEEVSVLAGFTSFDLVWVMGRDFPNRSTLTLAVNQYWESFRAGYWAYGSAIAVVLGVIALSISWSLGVLQQRLDRR